MIKGKVGFNENEFRIKYHKNIPEPVKYEPTEPDKKPFSWREWERQLDEYFGYY